MSLFEKINEDLKSAMKNKEKEKLEAIRAVKTAFLLAKTEAGAEEQLSEELELKIVQKLVKQRKDSASEYITQNRKDLADKELAEANFIAAYLPSQMSEAELEIEIKKIIEETGATSIKELGKVMGVASKKLSGKTDNSSISNVVKKLLS
ncbi:MAG: GatB/YqeY domain-containing protein [Bacteroidales bacterium]|nr:GatB/YqeY domain-containing protein [Bacteroidales bacterium]